MAHPPIAHDASDMSSHHPGNHCHRSCFAGEVFAFSLLSLWFCVCRHCNLLMFSTSPFYFFLFFLCFRFLCFCLFLSKTGVAQDFPFWA